MVPGGGDDFPLLQVLNGSGGFSVGKNCTTAALVVVLHSIPSAGGGSTFHQGHAMLLKHRGNGHVALGHGEGVVGNFYGIALHLPLLKVVPGIGGGGQGHGVASGGGGVVGSSRAALVGIVHRDGVGGLREGDLQLIQLGRLGLRAGEHQGAGASLLHHQVKGDGAGDLGLRFLVAFGSSGYLTSSDLVVGLAPSQLVGSGTAAVGGYHLVSTGAVGHIGEGNGVLMIEAVDVLPVAGPGVIGHFQGPLAVRTQGLIVQLAKLRLQGGSLALAREDKGVFFSVLRPPHQVSHGSLNGLLGIGKGYGGRSILCQYYFGIGNGLSIGIPAAGVPLGVLAVGLVHQSLDLLFGHFRSGNHRTGAADLPQARPSAVHRGLHIHPHIAADLTHRNCHTINV